MSYSTRRSGFSRTMVAALAFAGGVAVAFSPMGQDLGEMFTEDATIVPSEALGAAAGHMEHGIARTERAVTLDAKSGTREQAPPEEAAPAPKPHATTAPERTPRPRPTAAPERAAKPHAKPRPTTAPERAAKPHPKPQPQPAPKPHPQPKPHPAPKPHARDIIKHATQVAREVEKTARKTARQFGLHSSAPGNAGKKPHHGKSAGKKPHRGRKHR